MVVERQAVRPLKTRLGPGQRGQRREGECDSAIRRQLERAPLHQDAIGEEGELPPERGAGILDADESRQAIGGAPQGKGDDPGIGYIRADRHQARVAGQRGQRALYGRVCDQERQHVVAGGQARRQRGRRIPVGGAVGGGGLVQCAPQHAGIAAAQQQARLRPHGQQRDFIARVQRPGEVAQRAQGRVEACAAGIRHGLHTGGSIQQDDDLPSQSHRRRQRGARQRENQREERQQLQEQQPVAAELLPGAIGAPIRQHHAPKQRAGYSDFPAVQA